MYTKREKQSPTEIAFLTWNSNFTLNSWMVGAFRITLARLEPIRWGMLRDYGPSKR